MLSVSIVNPRSISVAEFLKTAPEELGLELIAGGEGLEANELRSERIQKLGLGLAGYSSYIHYGRLQMIGKSETAFLQGFSSEQRAAAVDSLPAAKIACLLITKGLEPIEEVVIDEDTDRIEVVVPDDQLSLAIGRRGTPRKLGVPGEEQSKVVYRLIDPEQYRGQHVLVVGGGDSAAEAALAIAAERGTHVTVSCRGDEIFTRPKDKNRQQLKLAVETGRLTVYINANVKEIGSDTTTLVQEGKDIVIKNDAVIVCAGGTLPTPMLKEIGVMVDTYYGAPAPR